MATNERRTETRRGPGRPLALPGPVGELAHRVGGRRSLARMLGVTDRTVHRWAHGARMSGMAARLMATIFAQHGLSMSGVHDSGRRRTN